MKPHNDKIPLNLKFFFFLSMTLFNYFIIDFPITSQPLLSYKSPNACIVLGEVVNVRVSPNTSAPIVTAVRENQIIQLIGWEANVETIGKFKDRWAKIRTQEGKTGYIFGAFIFEVKNLYKPFRAIHFGGESETSFSPNGIYTGCTTYEIGSNASKGTYSLEGRKITIYLATNQQIIYYISRYEQNNYLLDQKKTIDETFDFFKNMIKTQGMIRGYHSN